MKTMAPISFGKDVAGLDEWDYFGDGGEMDGDWLERGVEMSDGRVDVWADFGCIVFGCAAEWM